ncbi:hypothetical protein DH86_00000123, partial [Scytalidium sp. 3C]
RYVSARLGPTRNVLKISSRRTATAGECYIEILRLLALSEDTDDLSLALSKLGHSENLVTEVNMDMDMNEVVDPPHPITDLPAFFIHPCQTKEAMELFNCSLSEYIMVWLGIVGGCIGLWVPPEMAQVEANA